MDPFVLKTLSIKNLASLALPDFCPRCFWVQARMGFKAPWSHFPGVFSSIDSYSKGVTTEMLKIAKQLPAYLQSIGTMQEQLACPHWSKFAAATDCGLTIRGTPDELLQMAEGLAILDYKTSKHTEKSDELLPLYRTQLAGYRWLAEKLRYGKVFYTGLIYFSPQTEVVDAQNIQMEGFDMPFKAYVAELDTVTTAQEIPQLAARAKAIAESGRPTGRVDCKDCALLAQLKELT